MEAVEIHSSHLTIHRQFDPTRTLTLRRRFEREMNKRFRELRGVIRKAIVEEDVFALSEPNIFQMSSPGRRKFNFPRNHQKVGAFMEWLRRQEENGILETTRFEQVGQSIDSAWTNVYINDSYKRGVARARDELRKADYDVPSMEETGGIQASMSNPFHVDRIGVLYTRAFNKLKGITDAMDTQISEILAQGLADGDNPNLLARKLNATISGKNLGELGITDTLGRFVPAERRARMLARTEVIRAHHQAMVQEYKNWRVENVFVKAEWITAGDRRVCPRCLAREFKVYRLEEVRNLIPLHPLCRCIALPIRKGDQSARPTQGREPFMQDPVAKRFTPEMARRYMELKQGYRRKLDEVPVNDLDDSFALHRRLKEHDSDFIKITDKLTHWQTKGLNTPQTVAFKYRAEAIEKTPKLFVSAGNAQNTINRAKNLLTDEEYLKLRAVNQAYMEKKGIDKVTLYRGTDGPEGEQIRQSIIDNAGTRRPQFPMQDNSLASYTDDVKVADNFGTNKEGITIRNEFDKSEIVVHKDFLSGWTNEWPGEHEYITIGLDKKRISLKDIKFNATDLIEPENVGDSWKRVGYEKNFDEMNVKIND